jgi:hypothetical protein
MPSAAPMKPAVPVTRIRMSLCPLRSETPVHRVSGE